MHPMLKWLQNTPIDPKYPYEHEKGVILTYDFPKLCRLYQLDFKTKPSIPFKSCPVYENPHASYHAAYEFKMDTTPICEIRISLYDDREIRKYYTNPKEILHNFETLFCNTYVMNITQIISPKKGHNLPSVIIDHSKIKFYSMKLNVKNAIGAIKMLLPEIDNQWSTRFKYGYCVFYVKKNFKIVVVNVMFNDLRFHTDNSIFQLRFRGHNKCRSCNRKKGNFIKLKLCSQCLDVAYCSYRCQKYHWKYRHRFDCSKEILPARATRCYEF
eukprot:8348_1